MCIIVFSDRSSIKSVDNNDDSNFKNKMYGWRKFTQTDINLLLDRPKRKVNLNGFGANRMHFQRIYHFGFFFCSAFAWWIHSKASGIWLELLEIPFLCVNFSNIFFVMIFVFMFFLIFLFVSHLHNYLTFIS